MGDDSATAATATTPARRSQVELLLLEAGRELGRSEADMQPIIRKLVVENWLDSLASLRRLSPDQWRLLQLPLGLEELLHVKLGLRSSQEEAEGGHIVAADPGGKVEESNSHRRLRYLDEGHHTHGSSASATLSTTHPHPERGANNVLSSASKSPSLSSQQLPRLRQQQQQQHNIGDDLLLCANPPPSQRQYTPIAGGGTTGGGGREGYSSTSSRSTPTTTSTTTSTSTAADANLCGAVEYEVVDEGRFPVRLHEAIEQLQIEVPAEQLPAVLKTLFQVVHGVLAQPTNVKRRRLRKANPTFHRQLGQFTAAVRTMEAVGFAERRLPAAEEACGTGAAQSRTSSSTTSSTSSSSSSRRGLVSEESSQPMEDYYIMETAYIPRLTDCHHLLAQLAEHLELPAPPLPTAAFNPYKASIVSAAGPSLRQVAGKHVEQRMAEASLLQEQIKSREKLLQTGGGEPVALAPAVYSVEQLQREAAFSEQQQNREHEDWGDEAENFGKGRGLSAADIARIREIMGEGPQFKSRVKQELEKLQRRRLYKSCTVRVLLPDRTVLQLCFAPGKSMRHVQDQVRQFLHPALQHCAADGDSPASQPSGNNSSSASSKEASTNNAAGQEASRSWFLCETPPLRKVDLKKTLYEEGFVPTCTLHLKLQAGSPSFPYPYLNLETLKRYGLSFPTVGGASATSSSAMQLEQRQSMASSSGNSRTTTSSTVQRVCGPAMQQPSVADSNTHYVAAPATAAAVREGAQPTADTSSSQLSPSAANAPVALVDSSGNPGGLLDSHNQNDRSSSAGGLHTRSRSSSTFVKNLLGGAKKK